MEVGRRALEFSRKAIDAYKKTLLVDKVTSDDERSPPVYLLDEISDILRSCSPDLAQEIVEYTFRRIRHPSPQVKYKVLRFIKYTVNRAGSAAYRKELQSYSASIRELFNFQGQVEPFKGNALNQAVRDAAYEAIKAIFSSDVSLPTSNNIHNRIEGFGNGNFSKSFVHSYRPAGVDEAARGNFRSYDDDGYFDSICEGRELLEDREDKPSWQSPRRDSGHENFHTQSRKVLSPAEDRLLDNVTAPQGLRLQPSQESLESFLVSAKTLDTNKIACGLKAKLQSSSWQVRLKAVCVLQALLLQKDPSFLQAVEADEGGFRGCIQECLRSSQQTTLRKQAKEALDILLALKESNDCEASAANIADDASPTIKTCNKPFFTIEPDQENSRGTGFVSPSPMTTSDSHQQAVDILSFQTDGFSQAQAAHTSPNSVMDDPFDGMRIHVSHEPARLHVEDLLTGGWTYDSAHHEKAPFEQTSTLLSMALQSDAIKQSQCRATGLDSADFTFKGSMTTGKLAVSSLDSKTFLDQSLPGFQNLNSLHMFPTGMTRPLHNGVALQQWPGNIQNYEFGLSNAAIGFSEKTAVVRHGISDTHFKEFGLSS